MGKRAKLCRVAVTTPDPEKARDEAE